MKKNYFIIMFFCFATAFAQQKSISGKVTSEDGEPIPGVNIVVSLSQKGTTTDFNGEYQIKVNVGEEILVSYLGYQDLKQTIGNEDVYNFVLKESATNLDEIIITGYSTEKKKDITGAITVVEVEELNSVATPNVVSKLQSRVPGLSLTSSGVPGGNDTQISIRGLTSVFGGTGPLWVIDGVQTNSPAGLNPNDIESIQVLKDAASAGIYGTEAARGVIIVTTKQAKSGTKKITLDSRLTLNTMREDFSVLGAQDWLDVRYRANGGVPVVAGNIVYTPGTQLPTFLDANNNLRVSNTNWVDEITRNSISTTTDFGYSYATDKWKIFSGLGYAKDEGIIKNTYYERINFRINSSIKLFKERVTLGQNLTIANFNEVKSNSMEDALLQNPLIPVYAEDGTYGGPTGAGLQDKW
ncbi:carboxypeptidase-like regulatory domain-containing protein, partial [Polaribacter sp.]|uniref:carboxypeptidase-like regulatory domain-containing protein n=1 Tax=Polaribacter sp. TaxID=1920175 RepID=UPI003F6C6EF1